MTHSRMQEAEAVVSKIEDQISREEGLASLPKPEGSMTVHSRSHATLGTVTRQLLHAYPKRTALGIVLLTTQSFTYNAISFTYPLGLTKFYDVRGQSDRLLIFFRLRSATSWARWCSVATSRPSGLKTMISFTYALAGCLLAVLFGTLFGKAR